MQRPAIVQPGTVSPDGYWVWRGAHWAPAVAPASSVADALSAQGLTLAPESRRSRLAIAGALAAIAAEAVILVSYFLPYVRYDASGSDPAYSYAVFYGCQLSSDSTTCSYDPAPWSIAGSATMVVVGVVIAVLILVLRNRIALVVASGALAAIGIQETADWFAFVGSKDYTGAHLGIAIAVGIMGSLLLCGAGVTAAIGVLTDGHARSQHAAGATAAATAPPA